MRSAGEKGKIKMFERPAITDIVLTRVNFSDRLEHILDFTNVNEQTTFFDNLPNKLKLEDATFQRKDMYIRMDGKFDTIQLYNYGWYHNHIENMRFYFFIENVQYASDNSCLIYIKIDPWQTYQFQLKYTPTFIERKHVTDDIIGKYTYPEGLETGDYIIQDTFKETAPPSTYYCMAISEDFLYSEDKLRPDQKNKIYYGVVTGVTYVLFKDTTSLWNTIDYYNKKGKESAIVSLFNIFDWFIQGNLTWYESETISGVTYAYLPAYTLPATTSIIVHDAPNSLGYKRDLYTPKNNKLLTYPYCMLLVDNHVGGSALYKFEDFIEPTTGSRATRITFKSKGIIKQGCSLVYIPEHYKEYNNVIEDLPNYNEMLTAGTLPIGAWNNDVYANWFAANTYNVAVDMFFGIGQMVTGLWGMKVGNDPTGASNAMWATGMNRALTSLGNVYEHSVQPNQARGNVHNGDINFSLNITTPTFYTKTIKKEYAIIIDNFFNKYGYKVNLVETPNIRTRKNWNYLKTIDINFYVDTTRPIPQEYEDILKLMFDGGVTIWHNYNTMYNYNSDNSNL